MKNVVYGTLVVAVLVIVAWGRPDRALQVQAADSTGFAHGELVTHSSVVSGDRTELTVVDPRMRVISVYHVDHQSGEIALKSVRNINWDMQMIHFQSGRPLPQEIRTLLEQN